MGKQWKKDGKVAKAQRKGQTFTKLTREIQVSARLGGPDPDSNPRLKMAIQAAKAVSCPKETIEHSIKKGSGQLDTGLIEELTYEGYGPYGVGIIVECQTDNKNRTVSNIRSIFGKNGGSLGESGSVSWMFERVALIEGRTNKKIDPEEEAIEVDANDVKKETAEKGTEELYRFFGPPDKLDQMHTELIKRGWMIETSELSYRPIEITEINPTQQKEISKLLQLLDDNDDSHRVYASLKNESQMAPRQVATFNSHRYSLSCAGRLFVGKDPQVSMQKDKVRTYRDGSVKFYFFHKEIEVERFSNSQEVA